MVPSTSARLILASVVSIDSCVWSSTCCSAALMLLQRPLLTSGIDQAQIVDTGVHLRGRAGAHEVGDGDGGQQTDDRHDDHDFYEGEPTFLGICLFHNFLSFKAA